MGFGNSTEIEANESTNELMTKIQAFYSLGFADETLRCLKHLRNRLLASSKKTI